MNEARQYFAQLTETADISELAHVMEQHDGWYTQSLRTWDRAEKANALRQVEGYKIRIAKMVQALGNKAANRKVKSMLMWQGRGKHEKAQDAYWMMRAALEKAGYRGV